jgi:hypothetical protein
MIGKLSYGEITHLGHAVYPSHTGKSILLILRKATLFLMFRMVNNLLLGCVLIIGLFSNGMELLRLLKLFKLMKRMMLSSGCGNPVDI